MHRLSARPVVVLLFMLALGPTAASAESCLDQVRHLADAYRLSIDPPNATAERPRPDDLRRSQGVIEPPSLPDRSVISPPRDTHSRMPTVPDVTPAPPSRESNDSSPLPPSERATLQSILVAARAQAERGMEAACLERLQEARRVIQRSEK